MSKTKLVLILIVLTFVIGCASKGTTIVTEPMSVKLSDYKSLFLSISSDVPDISVQITQLESTIITMLRQRGKFEKVFGSSASEKDFDLKLNLRIIKLRKVSSGDRVMFGAFAGKAKIVINAELIDLKEQKRISAIRVEGKSSGGTVFAGGTDQSIQRAAEQVVEFIYKNL